mmetsp:Transcript_1282/g.1795  ORF Transcript_1282/g.1795 Transcript_1282/m.1795 type:complete len:208 (-) Transcript_1282:338-961(-)
MAHKSRHAHPLLPLPLRDLKGTRRTCTRPRKTWKLLHGRPWRWVRPYAVIGQEVAPKDTCGVIMPRDNHRVPAHGEPRSLRVKSRQGRIPHLWVVLPEFPGVLSEWDSQVWRAPSNIVEEFVVGGRSLLAVQVGCSATLAPSIVLVPALGLVVNNFPTAFPVKIFVEVDQRTRIIPKAIEGSSVAAGIHAAAATTGAARRCLKLAHA